MSDRLTSRLRRLRNSALPRPAPPALPAAVAATISAADAAILERTQPHTLSSPERQLALIDAVRYCVLREVPGDLVECGVWHGGSALAMILTLQELGVSDRDVYLYDTFQGMTEPGEHDVSAFDRPALETWRQAQREDTVAWAALFDPEAFSEAKVRATLLATGYPPQRIQLVKGDVRRTLPERAPERLALLRLDTDWYESTRHELEHLYPRLSPAGVLIVDDYGHWQGARRAVDEYFADRPPLLLNRIDYTGRIAVK